MSAAVNAFASLTSCCITLLGIEIGLRAWDGVSLLSTENFITRQIDSIKRVQGMAVFDRQLGWQQAPHFSIPSHAELYSTGDFGVRGNSAAEETLQQGAVLAVGDSFTVGSEVANGQSWPADLEEMLGSQVINAGVGGYGVDQIVLRAEDLVLKLHPKVLIVGVLDDDIHRCDRDLYFGAYKPYFILRGDDVELRGVPVSHYLGSISELGAWRSVLGHSYTMDWLARRFGYLDLWTGGPDRFHQVGTDGPEIARRLMRRLAALRDRYGLRLILVVQYGGNEFRDMKMTAPGAFVQPMLAGASENGIDVVDTFPALLSLYRDGAEHLERMYVMHGGSFGHMSPAGNALVAGLIRDRLAHVSATWEPGRR